jgi:histidinol dehydrogenase
MIRIIKCESSDEVRKIIIEKRKAEHRKVEKEVLEIIEDVRDNGDEALIRLTRKFDKVSVDDFRIKVSEDDIVSAKDSISLDVKKSLQVAMENITKFHENQMQKSWSDFVRDGVFYGQHLVPIETIGVYIPGGRFAYPSSVLMNVVPGRVAGVKNIIACSPPNENGRINPAVLYALDLVGVREVYAVGGAQAIAAMTYGTATIRQVDKIFGPGNVYVNAAKKLVYGDVGIDMLAGPSEVLICGNDPKLARFAAIDMIAQSEHDPLAQSIFITRKEEMAQRVAEELENFLSGEFTDSIAKQSLNDYGIILVLPNRWEVINAINIIAPEHLEIFSDNPFDIFSRVTNAGAAFLGAYTPVVMGDYTAGTNHVLPTNRSARFQSMLNLDDYVKKIGFLSYSRKSFEKESSSAMHLAEFEGLTAHKRAIEVRLEKEE